MERDTEAETPTVNGYRVRVLSLGSCGHKLYTEREVTAGKCVDCGAYRKGAR